MSRAGTLLEFLASKPRKSAVRLVLAGQRATATKVHDRVLAPLFTARQPQAPPSLRNELTAIQHHIDSRLAV
jgi:hypothetical protein